MPLRFGAKSTVVTLAPAFLSFSSAISYSAGFLSENKRVRDVRLRKGPRFGHEFRERLNTRIQVLASGRGSAGTFAGNFAGKNSWRREIFPAIFRAFAAVHHWSVTPPSGACQVIQSRVRPSRGVRSGLKPKRVARPKSSASPPER